MQSHQFRRTTIGGSAGSGTHGFTAQGVGNTIGLGWLGYGAEALFSR